MEKARSEGLRREIEALSPEDKSQLFQDLLAETSFAVFFSNGNVVKQSDLVIQINGVSTEAVSKIVDALASRIQNRI